MTILILSLLIGVMAGLRAVVAPAVVALGAHLGWLKLAGTPLAFMGHPAAPWVLGVLAVGELIGDQLPSTPSRKVPVQFGTRIVTGALCGATLRAQRCLMVSAGWASQASLTSSERSTPRTWASASGLGA